MRKIPLLLLLISVLGVPHEAGAQQDQDGASLREQAGKLVTVHAEVLRQSYCHVDDEAFTAFLDLRLQFTNFSHNSVILARKIEVPIVRVARNAEAGQRNEFLFAPDPHFAVADVPDAPPFGEAPDPRIFAVLTAGKTFETVVQSGVLGANDAAKATKGSGLLAKGSYVLQVGAFTWPYQWPWFSSNAKPQDVRQRWSKYGELISGLVYSDFAPFTLPEHFKNPRCPIPKQNRAKFR
jgi:hypothetical protein